MTELIKITEANGKKAVSARDLHSFLESKKQFADWIKHRIKKYDLSEGHDFITYSLNGEKGRPEIEFILTLDSAKELSMVEGNSKGKEARQYFIACENKLKSLPFQKELTRIEILEIALLAEKENQILIEKTALQEKTIQIQAPIVKAFNETIAAENTVCVSTIAKQLGMSAQSLNKKLKDSGVQYFRDEHWMLTAKYQDKGYTKTRIVTVLNSEGKPVAKHSMRWSQLGCQFIHELYNSKLKVA